MKTALFAALLNILQIAVAAAPSEPATPPPHEFLADLASVIAESPFENNYRTISATLTAYSATPEQTDDTPCIAASGYNICINPENKNIAAANFLPFGTKIYIPKLGKTYVIEDRMHARFSGYIDLLIPESAGGTSAARVFGKQTATIVVQEL